MKTSYFNYFHCGMLLGIIYYPSDWRNFIIFFLQTGKTNILQITTLSPFNTARMIGASVLMINVVMVIMLSFLWKIYFDNKKSIE